MRMLARARVTSSNISLMRTVHLQEECPTPEGRVRHQTHKKDQHPHGAEILLIGEGVK